MEEEWESDFKLSLNKHEKRKGMTCSDGMEHYEAGEDLEMSVGRWSDELAL